MTLQEFLFKNSATDKTKITHTRIGNVDEKIFPGKYYIPPSLLPKFYKLYYEDVFKNNKKEYLTEKQNNIGPVLIDLDFRYDTTIDERQHNEDHIIDIIELYSSKMEELFKFDDGIEFNVYVSEKPNVNIQDIHTKDGIHIVFAINMDRVCQHILRDKVLEDISIVLDDLNLKNSYEDVIDVGICKGYTNWQMYGSCKPGFETYAVTKQYYCKLENETIQIEVVNISEFTVEDLYNISAQNTKNKVVEIKEHLIGRYEQIKNKSKPHKKNRKIKIQDFNNVANIKNVEELNIELDLFLENIEADDYVVKETHNYAMCLGKKYYDNFDAWIRVGWALHNTSKSLFVSWMKFSSKSEKFSFDDIESYQEKWENMNDEGLSHASICRWAKKDNVGKYYEVQKNSLSYLMNQLLYSQTPTSKSNVLPEYDIALILYHRFKGKYKCAHVSKRIWYSYKQTNPLCNLHGRWEEIDSGTSLRLQISQFLAKEFQNKAKEENEGIIALGDDFDVDDFNKRKKNAGRASDIALELKKTHTKNNVMRECLDLFYERNFIEKLDQNPYLICFNNCVVDFKTKEVRDGEPEDYVSNCTHIDYVEYDETNDNHVRIKDEIEEFMTQLFPIPELNEYMWDHLASTLIGTNENQTFNMYTGVGRNGKSKLVELMERCLGDYKGTVPITLVTSKRTSIGSASPEIAQLKGKRYSVMQEPSKGQILNEGIMKEITGGDPLQGRALYHDTLTFIPQFSLAVCTNNLFNIKSDDDGTWRRIRVCEFLSKFKENPKPTKESPYEYKVDKKINEKFNSWKEIFMWMLVQRAFKTNGNVKDCDMVMATSNKYRCSQDHISEFYKDCVIKEDGQRILKTKLKGPFENWYNSLYNDRAPKMPDVYSYFTKMMGEYKNGWNGYRLLTPEEIHGNDE
jgi:P4 family phage/plasmid primase-like protien